MVHTRRDCLLGQVHPLGVLDAEHMTNLSLLDLDIQVCYDFFGKTMASLSCLGVGEDVGDLILGTPSVLPSLLLLFARAVGSQSNAINRNSKHSSVERATEPVALK